MKRAILFIIGTFLSFGAWADEFGFRLENDSDALVYYGIFTNSKIGDINTFTLDDIDSFVSLNAESFEYLPPRASASGLRVPEAGGWLLTLKQGLGIYQVYYTQLSAPKKALSGKDPYLNFSVGKPLNQGQNQLYVKQETIAKAQPGVRIDGRFIDWISTPDVLVGFTAKNPLAIYREDSGHRVQISQKESLSLGKAGTDLNSLKFQSDKKAWYLMASSKSPYVKGSSILLRLFTIGTVKNNFTIEIPVFEEGGPVLLWTEGFELPTQIGDFSCTGLFLEARFKRDLMPQAIQMILADPAGKLGVAVSYSDGSFSEEWQYDSLTTDLTGFTAGL